MTTRSKQLANLGNPQAIRLWRALKNLADDLMDPNVPMNVVEDAIRESGGEPEEIGKRGAEAVRGLVEKRKGTR